MLMRPLARRPIGRGGLLGMAARTAVVAGTATAVAGGMQRRQANRAEQAAQADAYEQQQQDAAMHVATERAAAAPTSSAPGGAGDPIAELERLAALQQQGLLTAAEFTAAKAKLLGL